MARKHQEVDIQDEPITVDMADGEPLYESDAYGSPQPDFGSDVTVMKQVGIGGPVPIVAPKHNTIQLQPIVVPLAVVPYLTQDSNVLRTDNRSAGGYAGDEAEESYREATSFDTVERKKTKTAKKKRKVSFPRIFSLASFIISALFVLPFLISYTTTKIGSMDIAGFNTLGFIRLWISAGFNIERDVFQLIYVIVMGLGGIGVIFTALGVIIGKYPKPLLSILSFLTSATFIGLLVYWIVKKTFVAKEQVAFIVLLAVSLFNFVVSIVFSILLNHREDREERRVKRGSEI